MLSSLPILPIELYRQIAFDPALSLRDLYALSLTTHALSSEAYSALYNRVELRASHETKLALRTFVESDRVAQMVRELLLRPDEAFRVVFGLATPLMIHAIHRMNNLKALTLGYLWTSNPFGEGPRTSNSVGTSTDVIPGAHDGMHPPSGPSGPRSTAWTRGLHIPFIDTLTIEAPTYRPIRDLFGELPYPLPHLISIRPMHICYIGGIRRVSCERVYGTIPVDVGQDQEESLLSALERLEIADLDSYPTQNNWAPHLTTVSMIVSGGREGYYIPSRTFEYMKGVKKVGPVFCQKLSAVRRLNVQINTLLTRSDTTGFFGRNVGIRSAGGNSPYPVQDKLSRLRRTGHRKDETSCNPSIVGSVGAIRS